MNSKVSSQRFTLPLLTKELLEQSARRRTYVLRVVYALLLFAGSYAMFIDVLAPAAGNVWSLLGKGRELYERLLGLQFAGVYLFMPAITCGVLTQEKERDSLMLLLLTRLDPRTIVFEKLLSRLVPMLCYLALSLPLLAIAYSLGGVTPGYFWGGIWMLVATALQAGTLAVACSAWFRTTVGAFIATYLIGFGLIFGPALMFVMVSFLIDAEGGPPRLFNSPFVQFLQQRRWIDHPEQLMFPFFAPVQFFHTGFAGQPFNGWMTTLRTLPILLWCGFFLSTAQKLLVSRAFVAPFNPLLAFWRGVDRVFQRLNQNRLTRGVVLVADRAGLPGDRPIAWRETTKRSFGRTRYLARLFLIIETTVVAMLFSNAIIGGQVYLPLAATAFVLLWLLMALLVTVAAASMFSGERTHQTLDVLCVTPLASREIIQQKFSAVSRLILVLTVPLLTVMLFEVFWRTQFQEYRDVHDGSIMNVPVFVVSSLLTLLIYPRTLAWLACWIGLRSTSQFRAIMTSMVVLIFWCVGPLVFLVAPLAANNPGFSRSPVALVALFSPLTMLYSAQFDLTHTLAGVPWIALGINTMLVGTAGLLFRFLCLRNAAELLGRSEASRPEPSETESQPAPETHATGGASLVESV